MISVIERRVFVVQILAKRLLIFIGLIARAIDEP